MRTLTREGFDSSALRQYGSVVQPVERMVVNHEVLGSSPSGTAKCDGLVKSVSQQKGMITVYTLNRYIVYENGKIFDKKTNETVKQFKSNKYMQCLLFDDDGKRHVLGVHSVVARFHCPDWFEGCVVHHMDENTHNNDVSNLQCLSRSEHCRHHADPSKMVKHVKEHGAWNKGKPWSDESKKKMSESAKRRYADGSTSFHGNQYVDGNYNKRG